MVRNQDVSPSAPAVRIRRLFAASPDERDGEHGLLLHETGVAPAVALRGVILPHGSEAQARLWLGRIIAPVYLGEAALRDSGLVPRLAAEFGAGRIGVYVLARRMGVTWALEAESNADFKVMRPSVCEPAWEILLADGTPTGTLAAWWIAEMFRLGASSAVVRVDIEDDTDLNILARLTESFGERLWAGPLAQADPDLVSWVELAQARQLVVTDHLYREHPYLSALREAPIRERSESETVA